MCIFLQKQFPKIYCMYILKINWKKDTKYGSNQPGNKYFPEKKNERKIKDLYYSQRILFVVYD